LPSFLESEAPGGPPEASFKSSRCNSSSSKPLRPKTLSAVQTRIPKRLRHANDTPDVVDGAYTAIGKKTNCQLSIANDQFSMKKAGVRSSILRFDRLPFVFYKHRSPPFPARDSHTIHSLE